MDNLKQSLLEFLKRKPNINLKEIKKELKITEKDDVDLLEKCLKELEVDAEIYKDSDDKYSLLSTKNNIMQGKVTFLANGDANVITKENSNVIIPKEYTDGLLNKDIITISNLFLDKKNVLHGMKDKIIKRNAKQISCEVIFKGGKNTLIPYNSKSKTNIRINQNTLDKYGIGEILLIELREDEAYDGVLIKAIGHKDEPDVDEKTIAYDHGFEVEYNNKFLKELEKIPTKVDIDKALKEKRVDLRDKVVFTIDGSDTKDIDDSIGLEVLPDGNYKLYISIADVSYYVKDQTAICEEAYRRGTSVYMNDTVIHMLHPKLSNGICSLHQGVDRLTKTCEIIITPDGDIISYNIYNSIINSKKKMNYEDVNKILIDNEEVKGYEDFYKDLKLMNELSKKLNIKKEQRGYLNFSSGDIKAKGKGNNIVFEKRTQQDAEKLIENFMLLANECVAEFMTYGGFPSIYRVHEYPDKDKILGFVEILNNMGFSFKNCNNVTENKYMQNLINELMNADGLDSSIYSELLLMNTMKRAKYSNHNLGHYGLALKNYTHFTSPIRRYADLQVHKLLNMYLKFTNLDYDSIDEYLREVANHCTERSIEADKAERDAKQMRMAEYMERHVGEEFTGIVTYIGSRHMTIKTIEGITGSINYPDLTDDNYIYDEKLKTLTGKNTLNEYHIGSEITFIVKNASKKNRTISFATGSSPKIDICKVNRRKRKH